MNIEKLTTGATRKTRLEDFGNDGHFEALEVLINSINDEAELTPTGSLIQKIRLTSALVHRLRIEELLKQHPEIHDISLGKIILITGLQRSGTTILHRLLNSHPDMSEVYRAQKRSTRYRQAAKPKERSLEMCMQSSRND